MNPIEDCGCIDATNDALKSMGSELILALSITGKGYPPRVVVSTQSLSGKRGKARLIIATFCPFCGERYRAEQ